MIPTLAARLRQQRLHDLAREHAHPRYQVEAELPLALQSTLSCAATAAPAHEPVCEAISAEHRPSRVVTPLPAGIELLLWLAVMLIDGAIALRDLLAQSRRQARGSRRSTENTKRVPVATWLEAELNPATLA